MDDGEGAGGGGRAGGNHRPSPDGSGSEGPGPAVDTTAYGVTITLVGAVLLAMSYYGYLAFQAGRRPGEAVPEPFYLLGFAVLFVVELLNSRQLGPFGFARAVAFTAAYGALLVFAVEGGVYLWERPELALEGFSGLTVLAASLVVAVLAYVGFLAARDAVVDE